jgi:hypothetical protein
VHSRPDAVAQLQLPRLPSPEQFVRHHVAGESGLGDLVGQQHARAVGTISRVVPRLELVEAPPGLEVVVEGHGSLADAEEGEPQPPLACRPVCQVGVEQPRPGIGQDCAAPFTLPAGGLQAEPFRQRRLEALPARDDVEGHLAMFLESPPAPAELPSPARSQRAPEGVPVPADVDVRRVDLWDGEDLVPRRGRGRAPQPELPGPWVEALDVNPTGTRSQQDAQELLDRLLVLGEHAEHGAVRVRGRRERATIRAQRQERRQTPVAIDGGRVQGTGPEGSVPGLHPPGAEKGHCPEAFR